MSDLDRPGSTTDDKVPRVVARRRLSFDPIAEAERQWEIHRLGAVAEMAAITSVMRAHQLLLAHVDGVLRPFGLTFARYEALALLRFSRAGELPLGKMGDRLMVHPASMTNAIDRLESQGLVERRPHPSDGRTVLARITDAGSDTVRRATEALVESRFGLAGLDEVECREMTRLVRKLRVAAGDFEPGS